MTEESKRRLESAQRTASLYAAHPQLSAIAVTGSVARGEADPTSDLDMLLYFEQLPSREELEAIREQVGGSEHFFFLGDPQEGACAESYAIDGIKHDFAYATVRQWEQDMAEILERHVTESPLQKALAGMLDAIPLYGTEQIAQWQAQAAQYPDALAEAMVKKHLHFYPPWVAKKHALERDDLLFLYEIFTSAERNILGVLFGLNRTYHYGEVKRMDTFLSRLQIAPPDLSRRLKGILRDEPEAAVEELDRLIEETFALVEAHMPQADTAAARNRYHLPFDKPGK